MSSITNPTQLVDAFKKSGEFDRLRKELLADFQRSEDGLASFKSKISDIARQRLTSDQTLHFMPQESVHRELMQEVDRYPIVERAAADAPVLSDPSFTASVTTSVQNILYQAKGLKPTNENVQPSPLTDRPGHASQPASSSQVDHPSSSTMPSATPDVPNPSSFTGHVATSTPTNTVSTAHGESGNVYPSTNVTPSSAEPTLAGETTSAEPSSRGKESDFSRPPP